MKPIVRFAPSPTGFLHIGGARTALFNWLYARHCGGKFLLRIEDTDRQRSTQAAVDAIFDGMQWLGLSWDEEPWIQSNHFERHVRVVYEMLQAGTAYKCFHTPEELEQMRAQTQSETGQPRVFSKWRDVPESQHPTDRPFVVRLKAPTTGETVIEDMVQGKVRVANTQLDDMILLRSDNTPTYMLSVVVDDHDMNITHIIRGDDHLNNAFRQYHIYSAMKWNVPQFAHLPLIHGSDGSKMSKRHGSVAIQEYRDLGILPVAMRNYLMRLSWSHGDHEIISDNQAIEWFDIVNVNKSPPRFDMTKLLSLNAHYIKEADTETLQPFLKDKGHETRDEKILSILKPRVKTLVELTEQSAIFASNMNAAPAPDAAKTIADNKELLSALSQTLNLHDTWTRESLETAVKSFAEARGLKLGAVASPLRAALTGQTSAPSNFDIMDVIGKQETLRRLAV